MGQYFFPILREATKNKHYKDYTLCAHKLDNGLKLTEHSYIGNNFMNVVYNFLIRKPMKVYWWGDYTDPEDIKGSNAFFEKMHKVARNDSNNIPYDVDSQINKYTKFPFLINHTKKEYIDIREYNPNTKRWIYHPLSLLTATSNGKGGGDYCSYKYPERMANIGIWKGDLLEVSDTMPPNYTQQYYEFEDEYLKEWNDKNY